MAIQGVTSFFSNLNNAFSGEVGREAAPIGIVAIAANYLAPYISPHLSSITKSLTEICYTPPKPCDFKDAGLFFPAELDCSLGEPVCINSEFMSQNLDLLAATAFVVSVFALKYLANRVEDSPQNKDEIKKFSTKGSGLDAKSLVDSNTESDEATTTSEIERLAARTAFDLIESDFSLGSVSDGNGSGILSRLCNFIFPGQSPSKKDGDETGWSRISPTERAFDTIERRCLEKIDQALNPSEISGNRSDGLDEQPSEIEVLKGNFQELGDLPSDGEEEFDENAVDLEVPGGNGK